MIYITLLKNQLKFSITTAACVFLLSACGSNSAPPVAADRAAFNAAVVAFDITTDAATLTTAEQAFTDFIAAYPTSNLVDDAYYYIARSIHERAKLAQSSLDLPTAATAVTLFNDARNRYSDPTTIPPTSNKADNAQLQIGKTYYDETTLTDNYTLAFNKFSEVLTNFPTSSIADDAQYYIGRTKHEQALLAQIAVSPTPTAATLFTAARDAYGLVINNYTTSTRRDDAQYQIGRTYYDLTIPDYPQAITEFNNVFTNYNPPSAPASAGDDARYYLGRSKHELALLPVAPTYTLADARVDYSLVIAGYPLSNRRDDAQYQIGRTHFSEGINFATALAAFEAVFNTTNFPVLSVADDARYYIGRSKHELASIAESVLPGSGNTLFAAARIEYNQVLTLYCTAGVPPSIRCDDAQFQIGKTYFDETTLTDNYTLAITEFIKVIDPALFPAPSAGDDAQYYIGRSKHAQALLAQIVFNTPAATSLFNEARTAYNVLFTLDYALSTRRDDAEYQIGRTYYDVAAPTATDYSTALGHFQAVISTYTITASAADDAQYYIGRTKHEMALLPVAVPAFTLQIARDEYAVLLTPTYALSTRRDDAQYQIGKTYFDDPIPQYVLAIAEFDKVLTPSLYTNPSVGDEAQFYKARSIHELALLGPPAPTPYTLANAIIEYAKINATTYPGSNRIDDAAFYSIHAQFPGLL